MTAGVGTMPYRQRSDYIILIGCRPIHLLGRVRGGTLLIQPLLRLVGLIDRFDRAWNSSKPNSERSQTQARRCTRNKDTPSLT